MRTTSVAISPKGPCGEHYLADDNTSVFGPLAADYLRARRLRRLAATSRVIWHRRKINNPGAHSFFFNLR